MYCIEIEEYRNAYMAARAASLHTWRLQDVITGGYKGSTRYMIGITQGTSHMRQEVGRLYLYAISSYATGHSDPRSHAPLGARKARRLDEEWRMSITHTHARNLGLSPYPPHPPPKPLLPPHHNAKAQCWYIDATEHKPPPKNQPTAGSNAKEKNSNIDSTKELANPNRSPPFPSPSATKMPGPDICSTPK